MQGDLDSFQKQELADNREVLSLSLNIYITEISGENGGQQLLLVQEMAQSWRCSHQTLDPVQGHIQEALQGQLQRQQFHFHRWGFQQPSGMAKGAAKQKDDSEPSFLSFPGPF